MAITDPVPGQPLSFGQPPVKAEGQAIPEELRAQGISKPCSRCSATDQLLNTIELDNGVSSISPRLFRAIVRLIKEASGEGMTGW